MNDMETVVMNIEDELQEYISQLDLSQKKSLLELIKSFVSQRKEAKLMNPEEYNNELAEAEAEYQRGESISHETMLNEMKKW